MLRATITSAIDEGGPMRFDEYMRRALYDPAGGFFAGTKLRSHREGDFLTSPEVSPLFGSTLAGWASAALTRCDGSVLIEAGAGSGSLLRPLLDALSQGVEVWAVEVSPAAVAALGETVPEASVVDSVDRLSDQVRGVVVANELLDNLPVALAVFRESGWVERAVDVVGDQFVMIDLPARTHIAEWAASALPVPDVGDQVEVQIEAGEWVVRLLDRLACGSLLVIDYGDTSDGLRHRRKEGTLRTYQAHHLGPDPLLEPGTTDMTVDIDFTMLARVASGIGEVRLTRQRELLGELGLDAAALRTSEYEAARSGDVMEQLRRRSTVTEAETLLHPRGLGDFMVMIVEVG